MPLVAQWNYHERIDGRGQGVITGWLERAVGKKAQARFERALDQLRQLPKTSWHKPNPASNIGDHTYVIRFKDVTGAQFRVFGHFYDPHLAFAMTFKGHEKDNVYYPANYQEVAQRYRTVCDQDFSGKTRKFYRYCSLCS